MKNDQITLLHMMLGCMLTMCKTHSPLQFESFTPLPASSPVSPLSLLSWNVPAMGATDFYYGVEASQNAATELSCLGKFSYSFQDLLDDYIFCVSREYCVKFIVPNLCDFASQISLSGHLQNKRPRSNRAGAFIFRYVLMLESPVTPFLVLIHLLNQYLLNVYYVKDICNL